GTKGRQGQRDRGKTCGTSALRLRGLFLPQPDYISGGIADEADVQVSFRVDGLDDLAALLLDAADDLVNPVHIDERQHPRLAAGGPVGHPAADQVAREVGEFRAIGARVLDAASENFFIENRGAARVGRGDFQIGEPAGTGEGSIDAGTAGWLLLPGFWRLGNVAAQGAELECVDPALGEDAGDLAAVVDVVGHDPPEGPLTGDVVSLATIDVTIGLRQVGDGPRVERPVDHLPRVSKPADESLGAGGNRNVILHDVSVAMFVGHPGADAGGQVRAAGGAHPHEPVDPAQGDVPGQLAHRPDGGRWPPGELRLAARGNRIDEALVVAVPAREDV